MVILEDKTNKTNKLPKIKKKIDKTIKRVYHIRLTKDVYGIFFCFGGFDYIINNSRSLIFNQKNKQKINIMFKKL